mmetsp:Transcript_29769/g.62636  ORF Transcript_29769/g.62636 Transcript_29769/m.62636 type:complete len:211 (-) Transcript_29769:575-1207(-)|eukprot:862629-Pleurochrysis_carterae.AAC.3
MLSWNEAAGSAHHAAPAGVYVCTELESSTHSVPAAEQHRRSGYEDSCSVKVESGNIVSVECAALPFASSAPGTKGFKLSIEFASVCEGRANTTAATLAKARATAFIAGHSQAASRRTGSFEISDTPAGVPVFLSSLRAVDAADAADGATLAIDAGSWPRAPSSCVDVCWERSAPLDEWKRQTSCPLVFADRSRGPMVSGSTTCSGETCAR